MWLPSSNWMWASQWSHCMKRDNLPPRNPIDESAIAYKILLWLLMSLCLWDTPYPHWSWQGGTQKGAVFLDLTSTIEKRRGKWYSWSCHYPWGFSLCWTLLWWALWPRGRYEVASLFWRLFQRKICPYLFVSVSRGVFCGRCSPASDMTSWGIWTTFLQMARLWLSLSPRSRLANIRTYGPHPLVRLRACPCHRP